MSTPGEAQKLNKNISGDVGGLGLLLLPPQQGTKVGTRNQSPLLSPCELVHAPTICQGFPYVCRGSIPHLPQSHKEVKFKSLARACAELLDNRHPLRPSQGTPWHAQGPQSWGRSVRPAFLLPQIATWLAPRRSRSLLKRHLPAASLGFPTCKWRMASTPGAEGWHCPGLPITWKA